MPEAAIAVNNIRKSFGAVEAVRGVSFNVPRGTVLGLLGPNGAGKTTLIRILTTLLKPDSGSASIEGIDVVRADERVRHVIGLAGQYAAVDENLTGRENLIMVGRLYHMSMHQAEERAAELLERFGLSDAGDRSLKTYSGGMRRRLDLALSLVNKPPVLFLDEPTTGLDPQSRLALWRIIRELVAAGTTVLLTTQYLEEADHLADNIIVIDKGVIIAEGTPKELKARAGVDVLEITVPDASRLLSAASALRSVGAGEVVVREETNQVSISLTDTTVLARAIRALDDAHIEIEDMTLRHPSLDEVFLKLTGHLPAPESEAPRQAGTTHV